MITSKALARKIFAPILATLMVAGLSTGLASPAKAANVSNTITIHYQDASATGFDAYKDWNLWLWANGSTTDSIAQPAYWNGSDSYGKSYTFTLADAAGVTSLGAIVRTDNWDKVNCAKCEYGGNRTITLDASGNTEVWILKSGDEQVYTSLADAQAAGAGSAPWADGAVDPNFDCTGNVCVPHVVMPSNQHVVIHYQDPAATKFSSYKNWDIFVFSGGSNHSGGNYFNGSDAFGKVLDLNFTNMDRIKGIGVIVRKTNWSDRAGWANGTGDSGADGKGGNRVLPLGLTGENEFWIVRGADKDAYYTSLSAAQAAGAVAAPWADGATDPGYGSDGLPVAGYPVNQTFTIHYNRPDGNYGDWNIWMWGTGTALDTGHDFTGTDAYGVYTTLEVPGDNDSLVSGFGYLLRSTHDWSTAAKNAPGGGNQDAVDNVSIPDGGKTSGLTEIWVKQGDATSYTSNPFPTPHVGAVAATAKYGEAVTIAGTGLTGASSVTLVRAAVPAVTATKVGNAYKCGSTTRSLGYVCTAAIPAATATAAAHVVSATKIVASFPNSGAITGKIVVTNPAGTSTSAGNLALSTVKAAPAISSSTAKGVIGDTVTVTGANVGAATAVSLGTLSISDFTVTDTNSLTFAVPSGATDGKISVTTPGGTATAAKAFALVPSISGVTSSVAVGGTVTVTGVNLANASAVKLGTKAITVFTKGATSVTFTVPAGSATGTVTVTTPGGAVTSADSVTVIPAPAVTSVTGAKTGTKFNKGATLTITGTNLSGATSVLIGASSVAFTQVDGTHITLTAPAGKTGKVSVVTPGGTGSSAASITTTS